MSSKNVETFPRLLEREKIREFVELFAEDGAQVNPITVARTFGLKDKI